LAAIVFSHGLVRDQIRDKLPYVFEDLGEKSVKNIARPVRVYALRPEAVADLPAPSVPSVVPISQPVVAPRLSIVVLPFTNLSNDPERQYFADGITDDLTTDLSRLVHMLVISRNTAFTYQNKRVHTKQIGRELGVRYVLEGSVRRSGSQVRVNAQLIDAENDRHVWAERFNGDTSELFALQDEITSRIAVALGVELAAAEATRPTDNPDALDYILRGRAAWLKPNTRESFAERIGMYEHALALDSRSVEAQSLLARVLIGRVLDQMADSPAADMERAEGLIGQALAASPRFYLPHYARGQVLRMKLRHAEAIPEYQTVIELNRNEPGAYANLGWCKLLIGAVEEAIPGLQQALRLSPRDHRGGNWYARIGLVHLLQSRTDEALIWLRRAGSTSPALPYVHAFLASAYGLRGETERAAAELAEARGLSSEGSFQTIAKMKAERSLSPKIRALFGATYFAGLRKAGMPEE
jgi:TolB-like protein/Tfp pilus assembly protein PilF